MQVPKHWSSPRGRGRRGWAIRYISVLIAAVLLLNFAGLRLFDTHPSVLTGSHPYHFPLYWEHISTIDRSITPFERSIMLVWREKHEADNVFNYKLGSEKEPLECREVGDRLGINPHYSQPQLALFSQHNRHDCAGCLRAFWEA